MHTRDTHWQAGTQGTGNRHTGHTETSEHRHIQTDRQTQTRRQMKHTHAHTGAGIQTYQSQRMLAQRESLKKLDSYFTEEETVACRRVLV